MIMGLMTRSKRACTLISKEPPYQPEPTRTARTDYFKTTARLQKPI